MATGVTATKGVTDETLAALQARIADLQRRIAERDAELAWMADSMASMRAAAEAQAPATPASVATAKAASPPPVPVGYSPERAQLAGLAVLAKAGTQASRKFWQDSIDQLGLVIAPEDPPAARLSKALATADGQALLGAKIEAAR